MNLATLNRWHRTIQLLKARPRTKAELLDRLQDEDFRTSARTLERDLAEITQALGLPISYDRKRNQYTLGNAHGEDLTEIQDKLQILSRLSQSGDVATQLVRFAQKPCLRLDPIQPKGGTEYLQPLLDAADRGGVLRLTYQSFKRQEPRTYTFEPALLTEWGYRWYVCGYYQERAEVRVFALDRIQQLEQLEAPKEDPQDQDDYRRMLEPVVGVTVQAGAPLLEVELRASPSQMLYLQSVPLHTSQRTDGDRVFLTIRPNVEFYQEVIRLGKEVEVLAPAEVRQEVARQLREAWAVYAD